VSTAPGGSAENPFPVRAVAIRVASWIEKLGIVWVEGQLTEIRGRGATTYMVLRDPAADMSLRVTCSTVIVRNAPVTLSEGTQVVVCGKPQFDPRRGAFSLRLSEIRAVGLGELLARIERLRRLLDAEGLFDPRGVDHRPRRGGRTRRDDGGRRALAGGALRHPQYRRAGA
jgi:exodeoxyribonuclease VII large subunit